MANFTPWHFTRLRPLFWRAGFAAALCALCCPPAGAQPAPLQWEVDGTTAAASHAGRAQDGNLYLDITKNAERSRVGLDYSVRWDFSDLHSFRPGLDTLVSGFKAVYSWDITRNTRLNYYGFRTNPWRLIISGTKPRPAAAAEGPAGAGVVNRTPAGSRRRLRLSVSPLVEDLKLNFDENLRTLLLRSSLKGVSPQWERAGNLGRKDFVRDVLSLGIWDAPLPGIEESRGGLEYLSK